MAATFREAFEAARAGYSGEEWAALGAARQAAAVYHEMRRIDAEDVADAAVRAVTEAIRARRRPVPGSILDKIFIRGRPPKAGAAAWR